MGPTDTNQPGGTTRTSRGGKRVSVYTLARDVSFGSYTRGTGVLSSGGYRFRTVTTAPVVGRKAPFRERDTETHRREVVSRRW